MNLQAACRWHMTSRVKHLQRMRGVFGSRGGSTPRPTPMMAPSELRTPPPGGGLIYFFGRAAQILTDFLLCTQITPLALAGQPTRLGWAGGTEKNQLCRKALCFHFSLSTVIISKKTRCYRIFSVIRYPYFRSKPVRTCGRVYQAPLAGIEPTTTGLEVRCSIR
jgi:hypothetical protein